MTIWIIARDALNDYRRRWIIVGLLIVAILMTAYFMITIISMRRMMDDPSSQFPAPPMEDMMTRGMVTFLYGIVSFFGTLAALFAFGTFVSAEQSRRTLRLLLAKPVRRYQYLLGKWLGGVLLLAIYCIFMGAVLVGNIYFAAGKIGVTLLYSMPLLFCKFVLVGSVAMTLSLLMPTPVAGILAYFAGAQTFFWLAKYCPSPLHEFCIGLYWLLPSYSRFSIYSQFLTDRTIAGREVLLLTGYAATYCLLMLAASLFLLRRRDVV